VPVSYELTAANVAEVLLVRELLAGANLPTDRAAVRLLGHLIYHSGALKEELAGRGALLLVTELAEWRRGERQQVEVCFATLKRTFGLGGMLATTLVGLATRLVAKVAAYTYGYYVKRLMGRPQ